MTRKRRRPILNRAGIETANAKSNVRIPFAPLQQKQKVYDSFISNQIEPFTRRNILPIRTIRATRNNVGLTKNLAIISPNVCPRTNIFNKNQSKNKQHTKNRCNNNDKIKYIPWNSKIFIIQCN
jgi:hypothetical protein